MQNLWGSKLIPFVLGLSMELKSSPYAILLAYIEPFRQVKPEQIVDTIIWFTTMKKTISKPAGQDGRRGLTKRW
ncbi:MAG TPA: hypothetical protein VGJ21_03515 [Terracidiphilus sp.]